MRRERSFTWNVRRIEQHFFFFFFFYYAVRKDGSLNWNVRRKHQQWVFCLFCFLLRSVPSEDGGRLPTWRGMKNCCTRNPLTLCIVPAVVYVRVWLHIPGDPQSVQLRNATTTTTLRNAECILSHLLVMQGR